MCSIVTRPQSMQAGHSAPAPEGEVDDGAEAPPGPALQQVGSWAAGDLVAMGLSAQPATSELLPEPSEAQKERALKVCALACPCLQALFSCCLNKRPQTQPPALL